MENKKKVVRLVCGAAFALLTLFTLFSLVTYLFTWTSDQSLLHNSDFMSNGVSAENGGGKIGFLRKERKK